MLVVFNLDWSAYDIHAKVKEAAQRLDDVVEAKHASHYVQFDLASIRAGEFIFYKSTPEEKRVPTPVLDEIRTVHAGLLAGLRQDRNYNRYRDMAETMMAVRRQGIKLAAVYNGAAAESDRILKSAHLHDYFETRVYNTKDYGRYVEIDRDFYALVMRENKIDPNKTLVVDTTIDGVIAGHSAGSHVLAYVEPEENELTPRYHEMKDAIKSVGVTEDRLITTTRDIQTASAYLSTFSPRPKPVLAMV